MRQGTAVHGEVVFSDPNVIVTEAIHLLHLRKHPLIKLIERPVQIWNIGRQVVSPKFHRVTIHLGQFLRRFECSHLE
jgi:hypothetical protein